MTHRRLFSITTMSPYVLILLLAGRGARRLTRVRGVPRAATALGDGDLYAHHLIDRREHDDDTHPDGL